MPESSESYYGLPAARKRRQPTDPVEVSHLKRRKIKMAFPGRSSGGGSPAAFQQGQPFLDGQFDIFEWYQEFQSCAQYFLDHAQHTGPVQAVAAFINIQLPFQRKANPILSSRPAASPSGVSVGAGMPGPSRANSNLALGLAQAHQLGQPPPPPPQPVAHVTLVPYIRRLVATGFDFPAVLHGFFGDDWLAGVGPLHEQERRNYLFAAKSETWLTVKESYDMNDDQTVPFLRPLQGVSEKEIVSAESTWSEWLAMQDWMLGPRAPEGEGAAAAAAGGVGGGGGAREGGAHAGGAQPSRPKGVDVKREEDS